MSKQDRSQGLCEVGGCTGYARHCSLAGIEENTTHTLVCKAQRLKSSNSERSCRIYSWSARNEGMGRPDKLMEFTLS